MSGPRGHVRSLRVRARTALAGVAALLALLALAAAGLESVSFGHQHLAGSHRLYHHHIFFGSHEHCNPASDHDHHSGHDPDHGAPAPHHRDGQRRTVTVSAAPALAQPVGISLLAVSLVERSLAGPPAAPAPIAQPTRRLAPPRAPPSPLAPLRAS